MRNFEWTLAVITETRGEGEWSGEFLGIKEDGSKEFEFCVHRVSEIESSTAYHNIYNMLTRSK